MGVRRRVSDKRPRQQPRPIGASSEGRLAWPTPPVFPATSASRPVRRNPVSCLSEPLRTTPHTKQCQLPEEKGSDPFSNGLILGARQTPRLRTSTSTQENGSRCAAQRLGRRLAVCRRVEPWRRGSRSRARASRAVLRSCSFRSPECRFLGQVLQVSTGAGTGFRETG